MVSSETTGSPIVVNPVNSTHTEVLPGRTGSPRTVIHTFSLVLIIMVSSETTESPIVVNPINITHTEVLPGRAGSPRTVFHIII